MRNDEERLMVRRLQAMKSAVDRQIVRFLAAIGCPAAAKEIQEGIDAKKSTTAMALRRLEEAKIIEADEARRYVVRDSGELAPLLHFVKADEDAAPKR